MSFSRDAPPLLPSDTTQGYRTVKAKLGCKKVRPWKWMPFANPARRDGAIFHHWRRVAEEGKDYPFARFNKVDAPEALRISVMYLEVTSERGLFLTSCPVGVERGYGIWAGSQESF